MQIFVVPPIRERLNTHSDFCVFLPEDLSTHHAWRAVVAADVYTRHCFSESMESRLGGPGQMTLQAMNEFTLFVDFCLIPLSKTCSFDKRAKDL